MINPKTEELVEFAKKHSMNETAKEFNVSKSWVYELGRRYGFHCLNNGLRKPTGKTYNKEDMIICLIKGGFSYASIGKVFDVSRQYIDVLSHRNIENTAELSI